MFGETDKGPFCDADDDQFGAGDAPWTQVILEHHEETEIFLDGYHFKDSEPKAIASRFLEIIDRCVVNRPYPNGKGFVSKKLLILNNPTAYSSLYIGVPLNESCSS